MNPQQATKKNKKLNIDTTKFILKEMKAIVSSNLSPNPFVDLDKKAIYQTLQRDGIVVIPDYFSDEFCDNAKAFIDDFIKNNPDKIQTDDIQADHRIFGAEIAYDELMKFYKDEFINQVLMNYQNSSNITGFVMAAKLEYKPFNLGSGQGWHRDVTSSKQFKSMLYLTDTDLETGPFQYVKYSHKTSDILKKHFSFLKYNQNRIEDEIIDRIIEENPEYLLTIVGKKGSLILADTRGIHRGKPIEKGERFALTNYTWINGPVPPHIAKWVLK